jgi:hypothetical protein
MASEAGGDVNLDNGRSSPWPLPVCALTALVSSGNPVTIPGIMILQMTNKIICAPPPVFYESERYERFETGIAPGMSGLEWTRK